MCNPHRGRFGHRIRHPFFGDFNENQGTYKVPVNIIKWDGGYEIEVFAPARNKEDFKISLSGNKLSISYQLPEERAESQNWVRREFSKVSFERSFILEETVEKDLVTAEYINGILRLKLPVLPSVNQEGQTIEII